jgi:hypothetical protein
MVLHNHRESGCSECENGTCRRILFAELNMLTWNGKEQLFRCFARDLINSTARFKDGCWSESLTNETETWQNDMSFESEHKAKCCK